MKKITKIETQKKRKDRVNVFVNDEFSFACSTELVYYHNLSKGREINEEFLKEVLDEDNYIKCKSYALKIIEKFYKTENEICEKLIKLEYNDKTIERVIKFLKDYGFVDDKKYVQMFIREKIKSCGKSKINYMLSKKGVSKDIIKEELEKIDYNYQLEIAENLAEKKYNIIVKKEIDKRKIYNKISNYLLSKGYEYSIINSVIKRIDTIYEENIKDIVEEDIDCEQDLEELKNIAIKRYKIITKSESDREKIYRRLGQFLLRKGYGWDKIKKVLQDEAFK